MKTRLAIKIFVFGNALHLFFIAFSAIILFNNLSESEIDEVRKLAIKFLIPSAAGAFLGFAISTLSFRNYEHWTFGMFILIVAPCMLVDLIAIVVSMQDAKILARNMLQLKWKTNHKYGMDHIQAGLHCCGINGSNDYTVQNMEIPFSCYDTVDLYYTVGCFHKYVMEFKKVFNGMALFYGLIFATKVLLTMFANFLLNLSTNFECEESKPVLCRKTLKSLENEIIL